MGNESSETRKCFADYYVQSEKNCTQMHERTAHSEQYTHITSMKELTRREQRMRYEIWDSNVASFFVFETFPNFASSLNRISWKGKIKEEKEKVTKRPRQ